METWRGRHGGDGPGKEGTESEGLEGPCRGARGRDLDRPVRFHRLWASAATEPITDLRAMFGPVRWTAVGAALEIRMSAPATVAGFTDAFPAQWLLPLES